MKRLLVLLLMFNIEGCNDRIDANLIPDHVYVDSSRIFDEFANRTFSEENGKIKYVLLEDEQKMLKCWLEDFVRTANTDYVSYAPGLSVRNEDFVINIKGDYIILNIRKRDNDTSLEQRSRKIRERDREIVDWVKRITRECNSRHPKHGKTAGD